MSKEHHHDQVKHHQEEVEEVGKCGHSPLGEENHALRAKIRELEAQLAFSQGELRHQNERMNEMTEQLEEIILERTDELEKANRRLERANVNIQEQSKTMLRHFACMSHEIRTPLNCVVGMGALLMDTPMNQFQQEAVRMITSAGDLLSTIVDDVLDYSKLQTGDFSLNIKKVDLQTTMDSVTTAIQMKADKAGRGLWVRSYIGTNVPQFYETDAKRLQQILYNLLGNAVKFSRNNAYIDLKCNIVNKADEDNGSSSNKRIIRFQVKDYGRGIHPDNYEKIFLPFHQENTDTGAIYGGTGLGLPITAKLANKLGGSVTVQSELGKWTEFTADFPYHGPEASIAKDVPRMANTFLIVVVARPTTDCPVMKWLREEDISVTLIAGCDGLEGTAQEIEAKSEDDGINETYFLCLVHDDSFELEEYSQFCNNRKSQLITFGYKSGIDMAAAHVNSPCRLFPSLFLPILGDLVERSKTGHTKKIETTLGPSILIISNQEPPKRALTEAQVASNMTNEYSDIRVLIAEDNRINQKVLTKTLNRLGLQKIDIVDNGKKAVDAASEKVYDVIFMDMEMPVMSGLEACREITKTKTRLLPLVVFVTAHSMESFRAEAREVGGHSFISKPFNLEKIDDLLKSVPWNKLVETEQIMCSIERQHGCITPVL